MRCFMMRVWPAVGLSFLLFASGCGLFGEEKGGDACTGNQCQSKRDTGMSRDAHTGPGCKGCIRGAEATCVDGTKAEACGSGGETCVACDEYETCNEDGECEEAPCSPKDCDGCCRAGECREGIKDFACGTGGEECANCQGEEQCSAGGECTACMDGCWGAMGKCLEGTSDDACGTGGKDCTKCMSNQTCEMGTCEDQMNMSCSQTCVGCCWNGECKQGASRQACGANGDTCKTCASEFECMSGQCQLSPSSRWNVVAIDATIAQSTYGGDVTSDPDPFLEVTVGNSKGKTSVKKNVYRAIWNKTVVTGASASDIMNNFSYVLYDEDLTGNAKIVSGCSPTFAPQDFTKQSVRHTCIGGDKPGARAEVNFRFEAN